MSMQLPQPHPDAITLSNQLLSQIIAEIKVKKYISFARYMALALYSPQLGYYRNALHKFGKQGDFVTAPEISPLFSYCLANQCADILHEMKGGDILEFGAGSGVMAASILFELKNKNKLPDHYYILELSASLKSQQYECIQKKIPELSNRVVWLNQLPKQPFNGIILANEVLDAMPVHLFSIKNGIKECVVVEENNQLKMISIDNAELTSEIEKYNISFSENYMSEINLNIKPWIKSLSALLSNGVAILIDYGFLRHDYYHPDRSMGTLMCHYQHHAHGDAFFYPGLQDITAHVDFTAIGNTAEENNFKVSFLNQAQFLIQNNLLSYLAQKTDEKTRLIQNQQVAKLTSPNEMGELFKVMVLQK